MFYLQRASVGYPTGPDGTQQDLTGAQLMPSVTQQGVSGGAISNPTAVCSRPNGLAASGRDRTAGADPWGSGVDRGPVADLSDAYGRGYGLMVCVQPSLLVQEEVGRAQSQKR